MISAIYDIVDDRSISVPEKSDRIVRLLAGEPDHGLAMSIECLLTTRDERVAEFVAQYVELLPDAQTQKVQVARRLRKAGPLVRSAARLVPWLPDTVLQDLISDYVLAPIKGSPLSQVMFTIALFRPVLLRPFADMLSPSARRGTLSGAPDKAVNDLLECWRRSDSSTEYLEQIAYIRTTCAANALLGLRMEIDDQSYWQTLVEMAGRLPDDMRRSWYTPSFMGFVVEEGRGEHVMGGRYSKRVPVCPICSAPSESILTLNAKLLPFELSQNPSFFWYTCDCDVLDFVTVQMTPDGLRAFFVPEGDAGPGGVLVPGTRSLTLRPHPNQTGISIRATGRGSGQHQVGGAPRWVNPEAHPRCPSCSTPMRFIASVDSGLTLFGRMNFKGILYCFWCDDCAVSSVERRY